MSIEVESIEHEQSVEDLLKCILIELKLLNARFEDVNETGIDEGDI